MGGKDLTKFKDLTRTYLDMLLILSQLKNMVLCKVTDCFEDMFQVIRTSTYKKKILRIILITA